MNESDFQTLYDATKQSLWAYIMKLVNDATLADDVVQESYIRLLQADVERLGENQRKSYLFSIATNAVRDHWRKSKRERNWFEREPNEHSYAERIHPTDERLDMNDALNMLSPQHRSLLWLAYVEEYEHKEIAEMMSLQPKSIRVLLFRARKKFIEILRRIGIEQEVKNEQR